MPFPVFPSILPPYLPERKAMMGKGKTMGNKGLLKEMKKYLPFYMFLLPALILVILCNRLYHTFKLFAENFINQYRKNYRHRKCR